MCRTEGTATRTTSGPRAAQAAPALGPYNHGVRIGDLLFCAGQIPIDPAHPNGPLPADIKAQTERVLENIKIILEDQKLTFANVVKTTVFMVNLDMVGRMVAVEDKDAGNRKRDRLVVYGTDRPSLSTSSTAAPLSTRSNMLPTRVSARPTERPMATTRSR